MHKYSVVAFLLAISLPALAEDPERIVQWKKDPMHVFIGPDHGTMVLRPKAELPPEAVVISRQDPLLGFKDGSTNTLAFVNKSEVVTDKVTKRILGEEEARPGPCRRPLGSGFARSC